MRYRVELTARHTIYVEFDDTAPRPSEQAASFAIAALGSCADEMQQQRRHYCRHARLNVIGVDIEEMAS